MIHRVQALVTVSAQTLTDDDAWQALLVGHETT
jgi:hypothetical protein